MLDLNSLTLDELHRELCAGGLVRRLIELARDEDLGAAGDVTSDAIVPVGATARADIVARTPGVASGLATVPLVLGAFGGRCSWRPAARDGDRVVAGGVLGSLEGPLRDALAIERTLLNLVGRLSGVATAAAAFVAAAGPGRAKVYDTRKTTPGLRMLEKYAARCGGAHLHRLGLHDAVLIKDNHLAHIPGADLAARLGEAARRARERHDLRFVEVEADSLGQLRAALSVERGLIDLVLLDNMSPDALREAVALRDKANPGIELEASGGVRMDSIRAIAATGVERISVGRMTHGAASLDVAMDMVESPRRPSE